ncbi:MAG: hypothetical protein RLZ98_1536 [Pseudomonadota bacterium]|jgi:hypothetical protein
MPLGVRIFVAVVFSILGLSFIATTGILLWEFSALTSARYLPSVTLATFYSHLFIFFPTFGIVALFAFYTPACVFTDMYMRYVPAGKVRFIAGFAVLALLSWLVANGMNASKERSVWEVTPQALAADQGSQNRLPILTAIENVRRVSQSRIGLSDLARDCDPDPLIGPAISEGQERRRFCLASTPLSDANRAPKLTTDRECCEAQHAFRTTMVKLHAPLENRSVTGVVHRTLLPLKIFFLLVLLVISIMLAIRWGSLERYYRAFLPGIEKGVLVGAGAMVLYPVMSHAFLHAAELLYGTSSDSIFRTLAPYISFFFGAWGLLLLLFFYRLRDKEVQTIVRMGGVVGSAVAIVKYEQIIDAFVRLFGSGASLAGLLILAFGAGVALFYLTRASADDML